jgi:hypothetical protein
MAQADLARLTINLFHLYGFLAPGTDDFEFHVKAPFKKEKGDEVAPGPVPPVGCQYWFLQPGTQIKAPA